MSRPSVPKVAILAWSPVTKIGPNSCDIELFMMVAFKLEVQGLMKHHCIRSESQSFANTDIDIQGLPTFI